MEELPQLLPTIGGDGGVRCNEPLNLQKHQGESKGE
jgi:hypothetical protein